MPRLKLTLAYEGTRYAGWQLQAYTDRPTPPTVQGEVERAVASITGVRIPLHAAGRTDAGVHAEAQVCHLDLPEATLSIDWKCALNVQLPSDIRILSAEWTLPSFHARKSATAKRYAYSLWMRDDKAPPRIQAFVWSAPELNLARMEEAAEFLLGEHDFASFQNSGTAMQSTVRTLFSLTRRDGFVAECACPPAWPVTTFIFEGNGFLKQMVRNLMGLLVWTGQGKIAPSAVPSFMAARKRAALPSPSAPARGLTLLEVLYP